MKDFVSFGTYFQLMYFMSIRLLKDKINGFLVPTFQLAYICDTNNPSHKKWLSCVMRYIICGGEIKIWNYGSGMIS